jgi:hypothetical protein
MMIMNERQARQRVIELVKQIKTELTIPSFVVYQGVNDPIAKYLGIDVKENPLPNNDDGQYFPANSPFLTQPLIILNPRIVEPERLSFTFFHEICHHLIRQDESLYSFLNEFATGDSFTATIEKYCNIGAAEFLIPGNAVRSEIERSGFQITLLEHFDKLFPASKPAIAIQLAQHASHQCFVTVCAPGAPPKSDGDPPIFLLDYISGQQMLYVMYSASSPSNKYTIGRYVQIPKNHLITHAYETRNDAHGKALIPFRSRTNWECECDAFFYKGQVYACFNITPPAPSSKLQPRLFD